MFKWINFLIVVLALIWVFWLKETSTRFSFQRGKISSAITTATAAKAEADRQLKMPSCGWPAWHRKYVDYASRH
jgi:F0F1-type ATP synthase membrane subunit b/b'